MKVALAGCSWLGLDAFEALRGLDCELVGIGTHAGSDEFGANAELEERARRAGVPMTRYQAYRTVELDDVALPDVDLLLSAGFRARIAEASLKRPRLASLNLHPSLLPRYRGRSPLNWAILRGESEVGLTLHHMAAAIDAGDIVGQATVPVGPDEQIAEVVAKVRAEIPRLLGAAIPALGRGEAPRSAQDESLASYEGGRKPEDGRIDWRWPARRVHDLVRAVGRPFPGAFAERGDRTAFIWRTRSSEVPVAEPPGELVGDAPVVATGRGSIEVLEWSADSREPGEARDAREFPAFWLANPSSGSA